MRMKDLHKLMTNDKIDGITISAKSVAKHDSTKCQTCIMAKRRRSKLTQPRTPTDKPLHTCHIVIYKDHSIAPPLPVENTWCHL
jgi:hypothetical protein